MARALRKMDGDKTKGTGQVPVPMLVLAKNGRTDYVITVGAAATQPERHAARELADYLKQISGVNFPVTAPSAAGNRPQIAVGPQAAQVAGVAVQAFKGLGEEGILIRTIAPNLILTGDINVRRGTLYAVYAFLEDNLGCRWWTPTVSYIPKLKRIVVPALDRRYVPPLEYRENLYFNSLDGNWAVRNRLNGQFYDLDNRRGGQHCYAGHPKGFVHTFDMLVPKKRYFARHPEWFALVSGKRTGDTQLCLSNQALQRFVTRQVKTLLLKNPAATIVSVSQNDGQGACECSKCRAIDKAEGSPAGTMLRFVNGVAKALEQEYPNVAVDTLAYVYTRKPPRITKPRSNVIVRLCSFECNFGEPLTHASNRAFRKDIEGWSKICKRLYVWDYVTNFPHFIQPHPNWHVLDANIRFFVRNGVKGIFEQGNNKSYGGEMAELRAWMIAKLLWDPARDGKALIREFLGGYYGKAAAHIAAYMRCIRESAVRTKSFVSLGTPTTAAFLTPKVIMQSLRHLDAAERAVASNPELRKRVRLLKLPCWYVVLARWDAMAPIRVHKLVPRDKQSLLNAFMGVCRENKITHVGEQEHRRLQNFRTRCLDLDRNSWQSPFIATWRASKPMPKGKGIAHAPPVTLAQPEGWQVIEACDGFVDVHSIFQNADGIVYLATRLKTRQKGAWILRVGHDGGVRVFIDGKAVITDPQCVNPANPDRSQADITLNRGEHELVVALDTEHGKGWGIFARFEQHRKNHATATAPAFPECVLNGPEERGDFYFTVAVGRHADAPENAPLRGAATEDRNSGINVESKTGQLFL